MDAESIAASPTTAARVVVPHSPMAKIMHWGFALFFVYALTKQLDAVEQLEDVALLRYEMVFAALLLALLLARFIFMRTTRPTALPQATPARTKRWANVVHLAMYASVALIALSGLGIGGLYWSGIKTGPAMHSALVVHEIAVHASYILIMGHVAAAAWHRRQGDGIWNAMVPLWKESKTRR